MDLYCNSRSGNSYKAALGLELAGLDWTPVIVDVFAGETRSPEFRKLNPMGELPVLVDGDTVLGQSGVILDYIAEKSGKFGGATPAERREIWRWVLFDNHKLSGTISPLRLNLNFLSPEARSDAVNEFLATRVAAALQILETALSGREWLVGDRPTFADLSCCAYLFYPEPFTFERKDHRAIDAWLDRIAALPGWKPPYELTPGAAA